MNGMKRDLRRRLLPALLRRGGKQTRMQAVAVLLSMLTLSFFLCLWVALNGLSALPSIPYRKFLSDLLSTTRAVTAVLAAPALLSLYVYCGMQREERTRFYATLASLGATATQCRRLLLCESALLYLLPAAAGALLGILPAVIFSRLLTGVIGLSAVRLPLLSLSLALLLLSCVLSLLLGHVPLPRGRALTPLLRAHNEEEAQEPHHYRRSYTFRHMPLLQRIAKKSVDYYKNAYRRISLVLSSVTLYPILAFVFFASLSGSSITLDSNPFDGVNQEAASAATIGGILLFAGLALLSLCLLGVFQAVYMIRIHNEKRKGTLHVYRTVGMTEQELHRVLHYEYRTVLLHAFVYTVFAATVLLGLTVC